MTNSPEARNADGSLKDAGSIKAPADAPAPAADKPAGAPETYATFTAPKDYTLDDKLIAKATPIFKKLGLSQEAAQELVSMYSDAAIANSKASSDLVTSMRSDWRSQVEKAFPGKVESVQADIGKMLTAVDEKGNRLISKELEGQFRDAADLTGAGDHPAFMQVLSILARQINEGTYVEGRGPSPLGQNRTGQPERPSPAQSMYPTLPTRAA